MEYFHFQTLAIATFVASFCIGCLGIALAKIIKTPAEIIAFPALIPMIPGIYAYKAILYLISFIRSDDLKAKSEFLVQFLIIFYNCFCDFGSSYRSECYFAYIFEQSFMMTRHAKTLKLVANCLIFLFIILNQNLKRYCMLCPVCNVDLVMSDRSGVEIDYCPKCRGVWLDRGELDKIIERSVPNTANLTKLQDKSQDIMTQLIISIMITIKEKERKLARRAF